MHREKTVARIVLVLSVVHGALAAPAVVRQRHLDAAEDVTAAPEKRNLDEFKLSHPGSVASMPVSDSEESASHLSPDELDDSHFTPRSLPSGSNHYLTTPGFGARKLHKDLPPSSETLQMRDDLIGTSGTSQVQDNLSPTSRVSDETRLLSNLHRTTPSQSSHSDAEAPPGWSPETRRAMNAVPGKFFNDAVKQQVKFLGAVGAIIGISSGTILYGVHKLNEPDSGPSWSYVSVLLPPSPADI